MKKIKFSHFETDNGKKTESIQIYLGNLNMYEWLDDVEAEMKIVNGDIIFNVLNQQYYQKNELKQINKELKNICWDNGYEFFDFTDINTNETYFLVGDRNSDTLDQINSPQNLKNINNITNAIK